MNLSSPAQADGSTVGPTTSRRLGIKKEGKLSLHKFSGAQALTLFETLSSLPVPPLFPSLPSKTQTGPIEPADRR